MKLQVLLLAVFMLMFTHSLGKKSRKKPACGGVFQKENGVLTSPGYPSNYPAHSSCTWDFQLKPGQKILFTFEKFAVEEDAKCEYDMLLIQEKRGKKYKSNEKLCGTKVPKPFKTSSNNARLVFTSDESTEEKGFKIKWMAVSEKRECGGVFNATSGSIKSPNYPGVYPNNAKCDYKIVVPFGHTLNIMLEQIDVELDSNCEFDSLKIFDGDTSKAYKLGKFCGTKVPKYSLKPSGNKVFVQFRSDDSTGGRGFKISWSSNKISTEKKGPRRCGTSKYSTRIVGGILAKKGAFPWQAALIWRVGISKNTQFCGGSLINSRWILTAAHCFVNGKDPMYYKIRLGEHDLKADDNTEQEFNVTGIMVHPSYNSITNDNDVALVRLSHEATIDDHVNTICLPQEEDKIPVGSRCKITGWGATEEHGSTSNILMEAEVPVVNRSVCAHELIYGNKITQNMMCAGFAKGGIDSCQGDSGGPMQCPNEADRSQWVLRGVTSWGRGCGRKLKYGVYAIVRNYLSWIKMIAMVSRPKPTSQPSPTAPVTDGSAGKVPVPPIPGTNVPAPPIPGANVPAPPISGVNVPAPPIPGANANKVPAPPIPGANVPAPPIPGANVPAPPIPGANMPAPPIPGANVPAPPIPAGSF